MSPERAKQERSKAQSEQKNASRGHNKDEEKRSEKTVRESKPANKSSSTKQERASRLPAGKSDTTTDHEIIRRWVEERDGSPAAVKATEKGADPGLLRINFPGYSGEDRLENIPWDEFFKKFDEKNLAFLYQDETRDGEMSRFWKFVSRESEHEKGSKSKQR